MDTPRAVSWEAPEFYYAEKGGDWYFALGIIITACIAGALLLGNFLFALLAFLSGLALAVAAGKRPQIIPFAVTVRGVRIGNELYPFSQLEAYHIDEEDPRGPQMLFIAKRKFMPLLSMPLPVEHLDDIEDIMKGKLPEKFIEEPFLLKLLEYFGF